MTIDQGGSGMGGGLVPGIYPPPRAMRPTLVGERWAVVAGHPKVAQVAAEIFQAGGNAVDAGVAAGLASNVVQVDMANFGGIAPILVRPAASDRCFSVAGVGRWSRTASLEEIVARHGGSLPLGGVPSIVPGAPAGWIASLAEFGTMSWGQVAAPAIELARDGFLIDDSFATSLRLMGGRFSRWTSTSQIYRPHGKDLGVGDRLRQPAFADLLTHLVDAESHNAGSRVQRLRAVHDAFYSGPVAERLTTWVTENGGYLVEEDLREFEAEIDSAPHITVGPWTLFSTPSWTQGPVALEILGILSRTRGSLHELVESVTLAFNDREDYLAAPDRLEIPYERYLDEQHLRRCADAIGDQALMGRPGGHGVGELRTSTTAVVTMDADGCAFATSPSDTLDGAPIIPELGIICSPRGVQSRLHPSHPNSLAPWARPSVTPAALIGLSGTDVWGLACPGGDVIVQALAQVVWNVVHKGLDLQEAVETPRIAAFNAPSAFHPHPSADRLVFVENRIGVDECDELRRRGHAVSMWPDFEFDAGSVQTIMLKHNAEDDPYLLTGADPRRSAYALAD